MIIDENGTRLRLAKSIKPVNQNNWLFIPGGPGVDSDSLRGLVEAFDLPGQYWLVDFALNGTNEEVNFPDDTCKHWPKYLEDLVGRFNNSIIVGHSFGGYLPFFSLKLEKTLKALIVIGSTPTLGSPVFSKTAEKHHLPSLDPARKAFTDNPSLATLKALYLAESDYFFTPQYRQEGIDQIINQLEYSIKTEYWWYSGGVSQYESIVWVPQSVPTLILTGENDYICPIALFHEDERFSRPNIKIRSLVNSGHFPWFENAVGLREEVRLFALNL